MLWKRLQLLDGMNWLNTLGGGYSALGDSIEYHVSAKASLRERRNRGKQIEEEK